MPNLPSTSIYQYLQSTTVSLPQEIRTLSRILEEMGVHALLDDVSGSPDLPMLGTVPVHPYEERLLRATGHPRPSEGIVEYLRRASKDPVLLGSSDGKLEEAAECCLKTQNDITMIITDNLQPLPVTAYSAPLASVTRPKRRKIFSGLRKILSGLVLLAGDSVVIPAVALGSPMALPVLGSLAGGIAAVGDGIGQFRREGE